MLGNDDPDTIECPECGCAFVNAAAFDIHRPGDRCLKPTEVGLVVAPRVKLSWSVPIRVPTAFDMYGNPTEFVMADPEVAGQWDDSLWHPYPPR